MNGHFLFQPQKFFPSNVLPYMVAYKIIYAKLINKCYRNMMIAGLHNYEFMMNDMLHIYYAVSPVNLFIVNGLVGEYKGKSLCCVASLLSIHI